MEAEFIELKREKLAADVDLARAKTTAADDEEMKVLQKRKIKSEISLIEAQKTEVQERTARDKKLGDLQENMQRAQLEMIVSQTKLNMEQYLFYKTKNVPESGSIL